MSPLLGVSVSVVVSARAAGSVATSPYLTIVRRLVSVITDRTISVTQVFYDNDDCSCAAGDDAADDRP